jgi:hypothetical protein
MRTRDFSAKEYEDKFSRGNNVSDNDLPFRALQHALDIRKFEIDLYWKRAAYFWTFIAATFGGFVAIQASGSTKKTDLSVLLCNLGIVFSFGWLCVNRGSKYWLENWENHVDMLEDSVIGPLYKVILSASSPERLIGVDGASSHRSIADLRLKDQPTDQSLRHARMVGTTTVFSAALLTAVASGLVLRCRHCYHSRHLHSLSHLWKDAHGRIFPLRHHSLYLH